MAALAAVFVAAAGFGGLPGAGGGSFLYEEILCRRAFCTILPGLFFEPSDPAIKLQQLAGKMADAARDTLLPGSDLTEDQENETLAAYNEYDPSGWAAGEELETGRETGEVSETVPDTAEGNDHGNAQTEAVAQGADDDVIPAVATPANGVIYPRQSLYDYTFLINNFYIVDSSTASDAGLIDGETLLNRDLTINLSGSGPKILIYHTHSQEGFADSRPGEPEDTVVGLGNTLSDILRQKYHIQVYHDTGVYDVIDGVSDRNEAYSLAQTAVQRILDENPSIKVVIDLHRDGVAEGTRLVTEVHGKPTAKIMFFNGLCRSADNSTDGYLQNPYLTDNLAFSLQLQIKAAEKYPDFTRRIYLRDYRYNLHMCPRSLLVECGAQTNTVAEAQNAMEPLADLLYCVLSGQ